MNEGNNGPKAIYGGSDSSETETFTNHIKAALGNELSEVHGAVGRCENLVAELHGCLSKIINEYPPTPEAKKSGDQIPGNDPVEKTFSIDLNNFRDEISMVKLRTGRLGDSIAVELDNIQKFI